mmetsp:Transcript_8139/g.15813  ORF Transcript_8139/g.15813 Transcript_8139/m.15813 type:complete len:183 (-) Transcript_8139:61-609(-)
MPFATTATATNTRPEVLGRYLQLQTQQEQQGDISTILLAACSCPAQSNETLLPYEANAVTDLRDAMESSNINNNITQFDVNPCPYKIMFRTVVTMTMYYNNEDIFNTVNNVFEEELNGMLNDGCNDERRYSTRVVNDFLTASTAAAVPRTPPLPLEQQRKQHQRDGRSTQEVDGNYTVTIYS